MSSVSRLKEFLSTNNIRPATFYKVTGISNGYLDKVKELGADKIEIIISKYPQLDLRWLITGKNELKKNEPDFFSVNEDQGPYNAESSILSRLSDKDEIIKLQREKIATLEKELSNYLSKKNRPPHSSAKHKSELDQ